MSAPGNYNIFIYQGQTYIQTYIWNAGNCCGCSTVGASSSPVDLVGYTATMQFRRWAGGTLLIDVSPYITLGGVAGTIALDIPASITEGFTWFNGVYDLLLTDSSGNVTPLLAGTVTVTASVST